MGTIQQFVADAKTTVAEIFDGFENYGRGIKSTTAGTTYRAPGVMADETLSDLVDGNWLARRLVRVLPESALMNEIQWNNPSAKKTWDEINRVEGNNDGALLTAAFHARTHGISLIILGQEYGGDLETPRQEGAKVLWLEPLSRMDFEVRDSDLDKKPGRRFGLPEFYSITHRHRLKGQRVHHSRCVVMYGPTLSDLDNSRDKNALQQASVLDATWDTLQQYGLTWESAAQLMYQASIGVWTMKGLISGLSSDKKGIGARLKMMSSGLSNFRMIFLDADGNENFKREAVNFSEVPEILKTQIMQISAAADVPITEIFGRVVAGLGDTGEVEDRKWERKNEGYRTNVLAPALRQIMGENEKFSFLPFRTPKNQEKVETFERIWKLGEVSDEETRAFSEEILGLQPLTEEQKNARAEAKRTPPPSLPEAAPDVGSLPETDPNADPDAGDSDLSS